MSEFQIKEIARVCFASLIVVVFYYWSLCDDVLTNITMWCHIIHTSFVPGTREHPETPRLITNSCVYQFLTKSAISRPTHPQTEMRAERTEGAGASDGGPIGTVTSPNWWVVDKLLPHRRRRRDDVSRYLKDATINTDVSVTDGEFGAML